MDLNERWREGKNFSTFHALRKLGSEERTDCGETLSNELIERGQIIKK